MSLLFELLFRENEEILDPSFFPSGRDDPKDSQRPLCGERQKHIVLGSERLSVQVKRILNGYRLTWRGISTDAFVYSTREAELARLMPEKKLADTSKKLLCPMPGLVVSIAVSEGQEVKAGDPLAIVEAMKMENILRAERDVTVKKLNAKKGDSLQVDAVIMEFA